ncbi:MAG: DUF934 domain-containing protein [Halioglobus sp.]
MPKLIKDGVLAEDALRPVNADAIEPDHLLTLEQWLSLTDKSRSRVQLEPGDGVTSLLDALAEIEVVAINFPAFTDGRGFSYARELRERGYTGELRAVGQCIPDQMSYLTRCGFNAFQPDSDAGLAQALENLKDFSEHYQAAIDEPQPLFRRRS